jgi:hypothetical protein
MKNLVRAFAIVVLLCGFAWMPAPLRGVATAQKRSDAPSRDKDKAKSKQEPELIAQAETTDYTATVHCLKRQKPEGVDVIDMRVTYKPYTQSLASIRDKLISGGMSASEAETIVTVKYSGVDSEGKVTWVRARFYDKDGKGEKSASLPAYSEPGAEGWQRTVNELFYTVMRVHRSKDLPQKPVEKQKPSD